MERSADVAQLVERNLAKVEVAGSNPVIRSEGKPPLRSGGVAERRGSGLQSRLHGFKSRLHLEYDPSRAIGAAVARFPDTEEVTGSIPVSPTSKMPSQITITAVRFDSDIMAPEPCLPICSPRLGR